MMDVRQQTLFKKDVEHNTYMELMKLEEEQLELERKLTEQKKNVLRQHLIKTINENKEKISKKKEQLALIKEEEKHKMKVETEKISEESRRQQEEKTKKKHEMKNEMIRQLQAQKKKAEDQ